MSGRLWLATGMLVRVVATSCGSMSATAMPSEVHGSPGMVAMILPHGSMMHAWPYDARRSEWRPA